jgi:hypothetical protein
MFVRLRRIAAQFLQSNRHREKEMRAGVTAYRRNRERGGGEVTKINFNIRDMRKLE